MMLIVRPEITPIAVVLFLRLRSCCFLAVLCGLLTHAHPPSTPMTPIIRKQPSRTGPPPLWFKPLLPVIAPAPGSALPPRAGLAWLVGRRPSLSSFLTWALQPPFDRAHHSASARRGRRGTADGFVMQRLPYLRFPASPCQTTAPARRSPQPRQLRSEPSSSLPPTPDS